MGDPAEAGPSVRVSELLGALTRISDLGMGKSPGFGLKTCLAAVRIAERLQLRADERADVYWTALLMHAGCTADLEVTAEVMGDEIESRRWTSGVDTGRPTAVIAALFAHVAAGEPLPRRLLAVARTLASMPRLLGSAQATCEVAIDVARRFGMAESVVAAVDAVYERWDGKGVPRRLKGEAVPLAARIAAASHDLVFFADAGGAAAAGEALAARAGRGVAPRIARLVGAHAAEITATPPSGSTWEAVQAAEPSPRRTVDGAALDGALAAFGDVADLVSRWFRGHARRVASLAARAAAGVATSRDEVDLVRRAALVHDVGRVGISVRIWDKPGILDDDERERVREHAGRVERVFDRVAGLQDVARLAACAHERLDGSGYPRATTGGAPLSAILAAADCYSALVEDRAHRPAFAPDAAAALVREQARAGRLDGRAVERVLEAAGHAVERRAWPDGLTEREVDVLRLAARGMSNKEIAARLALSAKTVGNHLQNLYPKIGVTTRAAAAMYAMRSGLLDA